MSHAAPDLPTPGPHVQSFGLTDVEHLDTFWELVDEILNAVLFVLLGLEVLAVAFTVKHLAAGLLAIPAVLLARLASVGLSVGLLRPWQSAGRGTVRILTWGGLRGALSVAMALSLPRAMPEREVILAMTYVIVAFSILVQGLTLSPLARCWLAAPGSVPGSTAGSLPPVGEGRLPATPIHRGGP